jgi:uncharacterized membrane protein YdjX (TVP38/TMEM64 family)
VTRFWLLVTGILIVFVVIFLGAEALNLSILRDPYRTLGAAGRTSAMVSVGLLIADIVLPVPSSLIMVANGALFGIPLGTLLSLSGSLSATVAGYLLGRSGSSLIARVLQPNECARATRLLAKYGMLAIIVTRPLPLLAEATAVVMGMSEMKLRFVLLGGAAGILPAALLYAITGAMAPGLNSTPLAFGLVLLITGFFWFASRGLRSALSDDLEIASEDNPL